MPSHFSALQPVPAMCNCLTDHIRATTAQEPQNLLLLHIGFQTTHPAETEHRSQIKPRVPPGKFPYFPLVGLVCSQLLV